MAQKPKGDTPINVVDEMKQAYGDYALAVIVGRAIPDLYDGLKPVTRRVMAAMTRLGLRPDSRYMKSARVEGETMGRFHPHGGAYGAMVTASQPWTMNNTLVDGWGNWGSPTDGPAAARYTEAKLTEYAYSVMLSDEQTWETRPNYDNSLQEPIRLNAKIPNVLINGGEGIAVGMATRIPTHNLRGIAKALRLMAEGDYKNANKQLVPDFPTGCLVVKDEGLKAYVETGHGSIRMRATHTQEEIAYGKRAKRTAFIFTNLPLHVNTEQIGDQIRDALARDKITTVADVRDETDLSGVRLVVVLRANADASLAEQELFRWTSLDTKFSANNTVIDGVSPVDLAPLEILERWMKWRDQRLLASIELELAQRRLRLEIAQGLISALDMIDDVIDEIRRSNDKGDARARLIKRDFTENQANAILDMRLSQLTKLDDKSLRAESKEIQTRVKQLIKLNSKADLRSELILEEIDEIGTRHGNARRSKLIDPPSDLQVTVIKQGRTKMTVATTEKPRFVVIDSELGVLTQSRKLVPAATVVEKSDKLIFVCDNGRFTKVAANAKGPLFDAPTKVLAHAKLSALPETPLIAVWKLEDGVYANVIPWEKLTKTTSRGKAFLPEGAELIHFGGTYTLEKEGRKRDIEININSVKDRPVGGKGSKVAKVEDCVF